MTRYDGDNDEPLWLPVDLLKSLNKSLQNLLDALNTAGLRLEELPITV